MPPLDLTKVHLAARTTITRHGDRALEVAEQVLGYTSNSDFTMAVIAEIKRLQQEIPH